MLSLYEALDLAIFRREGQLGNPTHQLYSEFIIKNRYVCPFCGIGKFKNRKGVRREDFDHYLSKAEFPFAAANMKNLAPACGTCNQDYKKNKSVLANGAAFYPYRAAPAVRLEVECLEYPAVDKFDDSGRWAVKLELDAPNAVDNSRMSAWDRVYSIKKRLEDEIEESHEEWMTEASNDHKRHLERQEFIQSIETAKLRAQESAQRRMEPGQIVRQAFYEFMLKKADASFLESFRRSRNAPYG